MWALHGRREGSSRMARRWAGSRWTRSPELPTTRRGREPVRILRNSAASDARRAREAGSRCVTTGSRPRSSRRRRPAAPRAPRPSVRPRPARRHEEPRRPASRARARSPPRARPRACATAACGRRRSRRPRGPPASSGRSAGGRAARPGAPRRGQLRAGSLMSGLRGRGAVTDERPAIASPSPSLLGAGLGARPVAACSERAGSGRDVATGRHLPRALEERDHGGGSDDGDPPEPGPARQRGRAGLDPAHRPAAGAPGVLTTPPQHGHRAMAPVPSDPRDEDRHRVRRTLDGPQAAIALAVETARQAPRGVGTARIPQDRESDRIAPGRAAALRRTMWSSMSARLASAPCPRSRTAPRGPAPRGRPSRL